MSEAFSLVMADIYSVAQFKTHNIIFDYDFGKRKIFPIYDSMKSKMDLTKVDGLKELLYAVSFYIFTGNDKEILRFNPNLDRLNEFKEKYSVFFWQDIEWNDHNFKDFLSKRFEETLIEKYKNIKPEFTFFDLVKLRKLICNHDKIVFKKLFDLFFDQLVEAMSYNSFFSDQTNIGNRIKKYLYGQLRPVYLYSEKFPNKANPIIELYEKDLNLPSIQTYDNFCIKFTGFLDELKMNNILDLDLAEIYKTSYPLFNPKYINYDKHQISEENYKVMVHNYFSESLII